MKEITVNFEGYFFTGDGVPLNFDGYFIRELPKCP